jgi:hypothetical protein
MASLNRKLEELTTLDKGVVMLCFSFESNTSSDPSSSTFKGDILSSVDRTAAGKWTCTLTNGAYSVIGGFVCPQAGTDDNYTGYLGAIDLTVPSVVVYVRKAGTADDMVAGDRVNVVLFLKKTQVTTRRS